MRVPTGPRPATPGHVERPCAICGALYWTFVGGNGLPFKQTCGETCRREHTSRRVRAYHAQRRASS